VSVAGGREHSPWRAAKEPSPTATRSTQLSTATADIPKFWHWTTLTREIVTRRMTISDLIVYLRLHATVAGLEMPRRCPSNAEIMGQHPFIGGRTACIRVSRRRTCQNGRVSCCRTDRPRGCANHPSNATPNCLFAYAARAPP